MNKVLNVYKNLGQTPLETIKQAQLKFPKLKSCKISYAGRLDPMAKGVLILLINEENKKRKKYERLKKQYVFEVLFGVQTDTYDVLGKIKEKTKKEKKEKRNKDFNKSLKTALQLFKGKQKQAYPPFSSVRVNGKPLFYWARKEKLSSIKIPKKNIYIDNIKLIKINKIKKEDLKNQIKSKIKKAKGDFRQKEILDLWLKFFQKTSLSLFKTAKVQMTCSSGTYVRALAFSLGRKLKTPALCLSIKRTKVGEYDIKHSIKL